jgi:transcriptional regulator GlxA family with amidase domain
MSKPDTAKDCSTVSPQQGMRIGFLLLPNYTMISLASAVEPLRMANQLSGRELYHWYLITEDGATVAASDGIRVVPDHSFESAPELDTVIVIGGVDVYHSYTQVHLDWLRQLDREGLQLGGICTGPLILAEAHLLDGRECSVHWESIVQLQEYHPQVICNNHLFTVERNRITCTGGTAPLDMMLSIIARAYGKQLAYSISEMFILDRIRDQSDDQKVPLRHTLGVASPKLIEATTLMEANLEEPLSLVELSQFMGVSLRQMERLFKHNLNCSPSRYYLLLRLNRARRLLKQTSLSIIEISASCGFVSRPHFSRCYGTHMGITPSEERERTADAKLSHPHLSPGDPRRHDPAQHEPHYGSVSIELAPE